MRLLISVLIFLCFSGNSSANIIKIKFGFPSFSDQQETVVFSDSFMNRPLYQNPVGNGWTLSFYGQQPQSSVITSENVWRITNMPDDYAVYTFDNAPSSSITEALLLVRQNVALRTGIIVRANAGSSRGYAVTFAGTESLAIWEMNSGGYWLPPTEPHGISDIVGKWCWLRVKMESGTISGKAWEHGTTEPEWQFQRIISSPIVSEGLAGIIHIGSSQANSVDFAYYSVGIDGASPTVPSISPPGEEPENYIESHYITQSGAGSKTGRNLDNAWSVTDFNTSGNWAGTATEDSKIGPGDVVYFSGTITTQLSPKGSGTAAYPIVLDGYGAGDCNPIADGSCGGATVTGGMDMASNAKSYLTFQDFNISTGNWNFTTGVSNSACTNIKILRNNFNEANGAFLIASVTSSSHLGPSYFWFEGNRFYNYGKTTDVPGAINFQNMQHLVMRGNYFTGNNGVGTSSNMLEFHQCVNVLVEYNNTDCYVNQGNTAPWSFKEYGNQNVIIRFNKFGIHPQAQTSRSLTALWPASSDWYIYGNYFYQVNEVSGRTAYAFDIFDGANNINIWANIFRDHDKSCLPIWYASGRQGSSENPPWSYNPPRRVHTVKIYNNTFHNNGTKAESFLDQTGLSIGDTAATGIIVKNNIFSNNRPNSSTRRQISNQIGSNLTLEHNTYFHTTGAPVIYHSGSDRTVATLQSSYSMEDDSPAGAVANPGLNADMTLDGTYINNGANLSGTVGTVTVHGTTYTMYWQTALHPMTDWSGQPSSSKIITANQNDFGSWERGAYVYGE